MGDLIGAAVLGAQPGRDARLRLDHRQPLQARGRAARRAPGRRSSATRATSRRTATCSTGWSSCTGDRCACTRDGLADVLTSGEEIALVCLSHVDYRTGALLDTELVEALSPAPVIWDLSHSAGVARPERHPLRGGRHLQVPERRARARLASCTCARTRSRPHVSPIQGWFGQSSQFEMGATTSPARGVRRFLDGHPERARAGGDRGGRESSWPRPASTGFARRPRRSPPTRVELHDAWLAPLGFELGSPRDPAPARRPRERSPRPRRGRSAARSSSAPSVIPDFREPDLIRLGFAAALHALRRRARGARPPARARRARRLRRGRPGALARDLTYSATIASISTSAPFGSAATPIATRAGGSSSPKNSAYTSFTRAKSPMSVR